MAFDEFLAGRIRALLVGTAELSERKMFGGVCFLQRGHMFAGIVDRALMARVGKASYQDALGRAHVREMDFTGKPFPGYVFVGEEGIASDDDLRFWLQRCLAHVSTLPEKNPALTRAGAARAGGRQRSST